MILNRDNIPHAGTIHWEKPQEGYPFQPMERYRIKDGSDSGPFISVRIGFLNRQEFRLTNGEVTEDVLSQAIYEPLKLN